MKNILIVSGHPNLAQSVANTAILDAFAQALPQAEIRKLDQLHRNFEFDIAAEQAALLKADVIVWQFPFSWYSLPALMKKWLDDVWLHGFAFGSQGQLGGKKLLVSFTVGAPEALYQKDGFFGHTLEDFAAQFATTAKLCGLELAGVEYIAGLSYLERTDTAAVEAQQAQALEFAKKVIAKINSL